MKRLLTLVVLSVLAVPLATRADGSIQINARAGAAKPFGDIGNGAKLTDFVDWAFPLDASVQFRVIKQLSVGAYGRFAPTSLKSGCNGCSANDLGFGGVVEYRFSEKLEGGVWLGASAGYQMLKTEQPDLTGLKVKSTLSGWEGAISGGVDYELGGLTLGPYLQVAFGEYGTSKTDAGSTSIASKGMHGFFGGGIRLTLLL